MKAYDHIRDVEKLNPADDLNRYSYTVDIDKIASLMESYHEAKLKLLNLHLVDSRRELLIADLKTISKLYLTDFGDLDDAADHVISNL
tara:strand:+ start:1608 stop:1871 length:264 start_codon:yes stop_codon:yes gene_type:complete